MNRSTSKLIALFFGACAISSTVLLSSCSKDDDPASARPEVKIPTEFSDLTAEQNKANLESSSLTLAGKMTTLKNMAGINTTISLNHFLEAASLPEGGRAATNNKAVKMMLLLSRFGIGKAKASDVMKGFRAKEDEDPATAQEAFDKFKGTYTFNSTTDAWEYTEGGDKIVFKFPSTETGTTNNAELAIYGYTSVEVVNDALDYDGDLPTALKADLSVGGTKQIEYSFAASYKSNGDPSSVVTSITIGAFKLAYEVKNTTSEVGVNYSLTENGTNLISFGAGASGDFNSDNFSDEDAPTDLVTSSSAYFQLMNIRFAAEMDIKSLADALENAETLDQQAAAYNADITLVVFYADSEEKIADTEFYVVPASELESEESLEIRLIFADGTPADIDNYTGEGFDESTTKWNDLIDELNEDLG
jgi:hypothetical protein